MITAKDARILSSEALYPIFNKIEKLIRERAKEGYSSLFVTFSYGEPEYGHSDTITETLGRYGYEVKYEAAGMKISYTIKW